MPRSMRSVDPSRQAMLPRPDVPRSAFDVVTAHKTTFDAGWLIPVYLDEVLPGDSHRVKMTALARLATPIVPVMDNLILESFFFFVPCRLLWDNWNRFMGEQDKPADSIDYVIPKATFTAAQVRNIGFAGGSLPDYMGISHTNPAGPNVSVSALPFRAYYLIWKEWFRDQDLQNGDAMVTGNGPDVSLWLNTFRRGKRHDYFTSCRPWPQKVGFPQSWSDGPFVTGASAGYFAQSFTGPGVGVPVMGIGGDAGVASGAQFSESGGRKRDYANILDPAAWATGDNVVKATGAGAGVYPDVRVLIQDMRVANAIQILQEKNARGGTRYTEIVRSHFGVRSPDARLQRPELLGTGRAHIVVNPVAQTSASGVAGTTTVLGELAGVGTAVAQGHGFSQSFVEHGYILGLVSVRADLTYQQGTHRMWFRDTRWDFFWPSLGHLGEQAVLRREIFSDWSAADADVFGFQERYAEYKYMPSRVSGRFRSYAANTLDIWHLAQTFSPAPVLNEAFIVENPPVDRVLQVGGLSTEQFLFDSVFEVRRVRPMPMYSVPGLGNRL